MKKKIMFPIFMAKFTICMQQEKKKFLKKFYLISNPKSKIYNLNKTFEKYLLLKLQFLNENYLDFKKKNLNQDYIGFKWYL